MEETTLIERIPANDPLGSLEQRIKDVANNRWFAGYQFVAAFPSGDSVICIFQKPVS